MFFFLDVKVILQIWADLYTIKYYNFKCGQLINLLQGLTMAAAVGMIILCLIIIAKVDANSEIFWKQKLYGKYVL